jgi:hypothetical protein
LPRDKVRELFRDRNFEDFGPKTSPSGTEYVVFELDPPSLEIELGPLKGPQGHFGVVFWSSVPIES